MIDRGHRMMDNRAAAMLRQAQHEDEDLTLSVSKGDSANRAECTPRPGRCHGSGALT